MFRVVAEGELVDGRQLEVRIDRVDLVARTSARRDVLVVRVGAERRSGRVERAVRQRGHAVVLVRVGQPHERRDALEHARATAQLRIALGVERVVERQPRHDDLVARTELVVIREAERLLRSEEHTSELQSLMRISYAVFCLKKQKTHIPKTSIRTNENYKSKVETDTRNRIIT